MPLSFLFNYINFIPLIFVPLFGIVLGFDAINRERTSGTLSRIMSQPVYRDSVINGKFLASLFILAVMMASSVIAYRRLRHQDDWHPADRVKKYSGFSSISCSWLFMAAFWISLAMLFSVIFRNLATSIICSLVSLAAFQLRHSGNRYRCRQGREYV